MAENKIIESSIATPGRGFEPVRDGQMTFSSSTLEVVEILCGIVIVYFIIGHQIKTLANKEKKIAARPLPHTAAQVFNTEVEAKKLITQLENEEPSPDFSKIS